MPFILSFPWLCHSDKTNIHDLQICFTDKYKENGYGELNMSKKQQPYWDVNVSSMPVFQLNKL